MPPRWAWTLPPTAGSGLSATARSHTSRVCSVCTRGGKGEEEGWRRSASLPTAVHTRGRREPDRTQNGPRQRLSGLCEIREFAFPSPPNLVGLLIRSRRETQNAGEGKLAHAATGPRRQVWDDHPPFTPLFPLKNSSGPPTAAPPPPRRTEAKTGPDATAANVETWPSSTATGAQTQLSVAHSPIKMRICFLPKRREKREEMVRPMAVVALAMGRSRRGLELPPAFPFQVPGKLSEKEEELRKKEGGREGSLADVSDEAPGQELAGRGPARLLPGSSGSSVKASAVPRHAAAAATPAAARPLQRGQNRVTAGPSPCASGAARATAPAHGTEWPLR